MFLNKMIFLAKKISKDFFNPLIYGTYLTSYEANKLDYYYFTFNSADLLKGGSQEFSFDENNIPIIPHYMEGSSGGYHYYPISIGQYALSIYHDYLGSGSAEDESYFLKLSDWFLENQASDGYWYSYTSMEKFGLDSPWVSAMTQGRALSVLIRAYTLTSDVKYLDSCYKALKTFELPSQIVTEIGDNAFFLQEYPGSSPSFVLNGAIFSLWGIRDMYLVTQCDHAKQIFDAGVEGVIALLDSYDLGFWSRYDLYHAHVKNNPVNACTSHYHNIHIGQMKVMYSITGHEKFDFYYKRWSLFNKKVNLGRAYLMKSMVLKNRLF